MLEICELQKKDEKLWDEYVYKSDDSTFYHQIGWKNVVEKTYGHNPIYLVAKEDGEIKGVLPLFLMKSIFFGRKLVSVPFAPYGGVCADDRMIESMFIDEAKRITEAHNAKYLELRTISKNVTSLISKSFYVTSILELDPDPEVVWKEKLKRNKRKTISKSEKRDLTVEWTDDVNAFYEIFSCNMRDLGSPVHSDKFFKNILYEFPNKAKISTVRYNDKVVYAAFYLFYKDTVINTWSSALEAYRMYYPTDFGIWNVIKYSCENGYRYYDFGRSQENSTNLEFKRRWSAETKQLHYQYYLNNTEEVPNITTMNPKRRWFASVWRRLPLGLTRIAGPLMRKEIP